MDDNLRQSCPLPLRSPASFPAGKAIDLGQLRSLMAQGSAEELALARSLERLVQEALPDEDALSILKL